MRVEELSGALLDYWVARAEGCDLELHPDCIGTWVTCGTEMNGRGNGYPSCIIIADGNPDEWDDLALDGAYHPSTDWSLGGPILARMVESGEFCIWEHCGVVTVSNYDPECMPNKRLENGDLDWDAPEARGESPELLISMCRALVMSKFGPEVKDIDAPQVVG